jgi:Cu+-exporting ATPase
MDCASCATAIERELLKQGALDVSLNVALRTVLFTIPPGRDPEQLVTAIGKIGYTLVPASSRRAISPSSEPPPIRHFTIAFLLTLPLWAGMIMHAPLIHEPIVYHVLGIAVWALGASKLGGSAFRSALRGYPTMETLIIGGATASLVAGIFADVTRSGMGHHLSETAASIITFALLGQVLEKRALIRTNSAMDELVKLAPESAVVVRGVGEQAETERIPAVQLIGGDRVLVNGGETIPGDGTVYWGEGITDESMMTGEAIPIQKGRGDTVIAGTLLTSGSIKVRLTRVGAQSTLGQIITLLADSQMHRPPIQRIGDKVSGIFIPIVCTLAASTILISWTFFEVPFLDALLRGIAVLAASCPCAVGLATPTAVSVALGRAARHGVLIKGGEILEALASIRQVGFDKTGTITSGSFTVTSVNCPPSSTDELRSIVRTLEVHSTHPIARSLVAYFADAPLRELTSVLDKRNEGIVGQSANGDTLELRPQPASNDRTDAAFTIAILKNGTILGEITIEDSLHFDASIVMTTLREQGIETFLLSGDTTHRVERIARSIGISSWHAHCSPAEKLDHIRKRRASSPIAFVGDGVNDSLALTEATVGIAIRGGAETAMKSGDVILLAPQLQLIPALLELGTATYRTIIGNFIWAFGYNAIAIPLAMTGVISPAYGALAMALSDLVVVGNSLLLNKRSLPSGELI